VKFQYLVAVDVRDRVGVAKQTRSTSKKTVRWWVYMVRCADGSLYTGASNNVEARVAKHNLKKGARYTRSRTPVKLVFKQAKKNKSYAMSLEAKIKQLTRAEKLKLISAKRG
jgi:putative endonuclease